MTNKTFKLLLVASVLLASIFYIADASSEFDNTDSTKPKPVGASTVHDVLVQICTQWGMQRNFLQLKQFLESNYPELAGHVRGETYPIPPFALYAQQLLTLIQLFLMATFLMGESIFSFLPFGVPSWYWKMKEQPAMFLIVAFLVAPTMIQSYMQSNAFEVILDGVVVFSRLETGRMPNGQDITSAFMKAGLRAVTE